MIALASILPVIISLMGQIDDIESELNMAKEAMKKLVSENAQKIKLWFEGEEDRARKLKTGSFEKVQEIKKEFQAYSESKELPKRAPNELKDAESKAVSFLILAYKKAIDSYTKLKKDDVAETLNNEMIQLIKNRPTTGRLSYSISVVTITNSRLLQSEQSRMLNLPSTKNIEISKGAKMLFVLIPAGKITVAVNANDFKKDNQISTQEIVIGKPFYLGKFELNQNQWTAVMKTNPSKYKGPLLPVDNISFSDLENFVIKTRIETGLKMFIPTEAQWEYACRAGSVTAYSFGDQCNGTQANTDGGYPYGSIARGPNLGRPTPVGKYPPNPWGLHDMHGNVWEWCHPDNAAQSDEKTERFSLTNRGKIYPLRGGSWFVRPELCRSSFQGGPYNPDLSSHDFGARIGIIID